MLSNNDSVVTDTANANGPFVYNGPRIHPFGRLSLCLPWEGLRLQLGLSYHNGDEAPVSWDYELPAEFIAAWDAPTKLDGLWPLLSWDGAAEVRRAVKRGGLSLALLQQHSACAILVLGRDTGTGLRTLRKIQASLHRLGYYGVLLKDIPDTEFSYQTIEEKLLTVASHCAFVIVEDSIVSGHIAEISLLARTRKTITVLKCIGQGSTWVTADYSLDFRNIHVINYSSADLAQSVAKAVDWAEVAIGEREYALRTTYPWRTHEKYI